MPRTPKKPVLARARSPKTAVEAVLDVAATLVPEPGYVNGTEYADWFVKATPDLLRALADLAHHHNESELADNLTRFSGPMCLEPLYDDLAENRSPQKFCAAMVGCDGEPCSEHSPENADALGRCVYPDRGRLCRERRLSGRDRCAHHIEVCLVVKRDGKLCGMRSCGVPKHKQVTAMAAAEAAALQSS